MTALPSNLALTNVADGASIIASDHRNNYSAIQTFTNALNAILAAGTTGQYFTGNGTAVSFAYPPGYEFPGSYVEATATVNVAAASEATATTVVTAGAVTFDGSTTVMVEFFAPDARPDTAAAGATMFFALYDGAASIGVFVGRAEVGTGSDRVAINLKRRLTPSAAAHTYSMRAWVSAGTGQVLAGAGGVGANMPAFIRITKV